MIEFLSGVRHKCRRLSQRFRPSGRQSSKIYRREVSSGFNFPNYIFIGADAYAFTKGFADME